MKNKISKLLVALIFILGISLSAQEKVIVQLNVFEQLPEISLATFMTAEGLENTPRIAQVIMTPHGKNVIVQGVVRWRKVNGTSFEELFSYTTKPFLSRNFYNNDYSSINGIEIKDSDSNQDLIDENLKIGKASGSYELIIEVYDENMNFQSRDEKFLGLVLPASIVGKEIPIGLVNPTQTIAIIQPTLDEELDLGGIQVTWSEVKGVFNYFVKANFRDSKFQSLEDALQSGTPFVNNEDVGFQTSINLREYMKRELVGGEEIVVQIRCEVIGADGPTFIYTDIVNFSLKSAGSPVVDKGVQELETLIVDVLDEWEQQGQGESEAFEVLEDLLSDLQNGNISFTDIKIRSDSGQLLTYAEFQQILEYLRRNPDLLTNLNFESN